MMLALLALAPGDSLPAPAYEVDGPRMAYTVPEYMDTTVVAWATYGLEPVVETPEGEQVLVLLWLPGQDTGVEALPPLPGDAQAALPGQPGSGACGAIFSWGRE